MRARGLRISFASHIEHGHPFLRAGDFLRGPDGNEETRAFSVPDNATDRKGMIQEDDLAPNLQVFRLRDDVVGDYFVRSFERPAITKEETFAQGVEALVINPVNHH